MGEEEQVQHETEADKQEPDTHPAEGKADEPEPGDEATEAPETAAEPAASPGDAHAVGVASPALGEPPAAAWPPAAERAMVHQLLVTKPEGDAALDLIGATPYAGWNEPREGPNGRTWLVTVSEADKDNFLAQADQVGCSVQELHPGSEEVEHVQGDEGAGWVMPGDQAPQAAQPEPEPEEGQDEPEPEAESEAKAQDEPEPAPAG